MLYKVEWYDSNGKVTNHGLFATNNEISVEATPNMKWSIGMRYSSIADWFQGKNAKIKYQSEKTRIS